MEDNKTMMEEEARMDAIVENGEKKSTKNLLIGALVVGGGALLVRSIYKKKIKPAIKRAIREAIREENHIYEAECEECAEDSKD